MTFPYWMRGLSILFLPIAAIHELGIWRGLLLVAVVNVLTPWHPQAES